MASTIKSKDLVFRISSEERDKLKTISKVYGHPMAEIIKSELKKVLIKHGYSIL